MGYQTILYDVAGRIARLTLNRPERLNSFNAAMHAEVRDALGRVSVDGARVLVLTGAGRGFCAGQDLGERQPAPDGARPDLGESIERNYKPLVLALSALPVPTIAAVNGVAAGAGASIALACDLVVAAKSAAFIQAFSKLGLVPDAGATWQLPRLVGRARALGLAMLGERLPAETGRRLGADLALRRGRGFSGACRAACGRAGCGADPQPGAHARGDAGVRLADARGAARSRARLPARARLHRGLRRGCRRVRREARAALHGAVTAPMDAKQPDRDEEQRQRTAERSAQALWSGDAASRHLGMAVDSCGPGRASVSMRIRPEMVNGHGICHGGLVFALADSAFAFACNSYGHNTVAAGASIEFLAPGREGDTLRANAVGTLARGTRGHLRNRGPQPAGRARRLCSAGAATR